MNLKKKFIEFGEILGYIFFVEVPADRKRLEAGQIPLVLISVSAGLLYSVFAAFLVSCLGFFAGIPISKYHIIAAVILAFSALFIHIRNMAGDRPLRYAATIVLISILLIISLWLGSIFYDLSYDGQTYHQEMVIALAGGWNPFYDRLTDDTSPDISYQKLLNSYPKASEIVEAVIYKNTGRIETAKALNFIMMFMAFSALLSFFMRFRSISRISAIVGSVLLMLNPVFITQSFSFYLDGQVYFALMALGAMLGIFALYHRNHLVILIMMSVALLWNLKLIALAASCVFIIGFMVVSWYREKVLVFFKILLAFVLTGAVSIFILGFNPYITNLKWFGHPLYPAYGQGATDYITPNMPSTFFDKNRIERMAISIFSRSEMQRGPGTTHTFKRPFTYDIAEKDSFSTTNSTLGGFGPLFGGAMILSMMIGAGVAFLPQKKKYSAEYRTVLFSLIVIVISSIILPISNYARYIPQLWAIAPIAAIYALSIKNYPIRILGLLLSAVLAWNIWIVADRYYTFTARQSELLSDQLSELREMSEKNKLTVSFGDFRSNRARFREAGINFEEQKELSCPARRVLITTIPESNIRICDVK